MSRLRALPDRQGALLLRRGALLTWALAALGLAILLVAGDLLVKGAVNVALRLGLPPLIVGLTIVAFGTSAPELLISVDAVLEDAPGIALGNVVGSNIANVLAVLGLPALIFGLATKGTGTSKSYVVMLAATALFIGLAFAGPFGTVSALVMLAVLAVILAEQFREGLKTRAPVEEVEGADPQMRWWRILAFLAVGLVGLPIGANVLIANAKQIAQSMGVSDSVIGLTMVAIGTSLPELATTMAAAAKRQADVALGNVLGSNMFNLLAIIGIAALVGEIPVADSFLRVDLWVMAASSLLLVPFVFTSLPMTRPVGAAFCAAYGAYLWVVVVS